MGLMGVACGLDLAGYVGERSRAARVGIARGDVGSETFGPCDDAVEGDIRVGATLPLDDLNQFNKWLEEDKINMADLINILEQAGYDVSALNTEMERLDASAITYAGLDAEKLANWLDEAANATERLALATKLYYKNQKKDDISKEMDYAKKLREAAFGQSREDLYTKEEQLS